MKVFCLSLFYVMLNHMIAQFSKLLVPIFGLRSTTKLWHLNFAHAAPLRPLLCVSKFSNQSTQSLTYLRGKFLKNLLTNRSLKNTPSNLLTCYQSDKGLH